MKSLINIALRYLSVTRCFFYGFFTGQALAFYILNNMFLDGKITPPIICLHWFAATFHNETKLTLKLVLQNPSLQLFNRSANILFKPLCQFSSNACFAIAYVGFHRRYRRLYSV